MPRPCELHCDRCDEWKPQDSFSVEQQKDIHDDYRYCLVHTAGRQDNYVERLQARAERLAPVLRDGEESEEESSESDSGDISGEIADSEGGVILTFGKYAGRTQAEVYATDPQYCFWISQRPPEGNNNLAFANFQEYIANRKRKEAARQAKRKAKAEEKRQKRIAARKVVTLEDEYSSSDESFIVNDDEESENTGENSDGGASSGEHRHHELIGGKHRNMREEDSGEGGTSESETGSDTEELVKEASAEYLSEEGTDSEGPATRTRGRNRYGDRKNRKTSQVDRMSRLSNSENESSASECGTEELLGEAAGGLSPEESDVSAGPATRTRSTHPVHKKVTQKIARKKNKIVTPDTKGRAGGRATDRRKVPAKPLKDKGKGKEKWSEEGRRKIAMKSDSDSETENSYESSASTSGRVGKKGAKGKEKASPPITPVHPHTHTRSADRSKQSSSSIDKSKKGKKRLLRRSDDWKNEERSPESSSLDLECQPAPPPPKKKKLMKTGDLDEVRKIERRNRYKDKGSSSVCADTVCGTCNGSGKAPLRLDFSDSDEELF